MAIGAVAAAAAWLLRRGVPDRISASFICPRSDDDRIIILQNVFGYAIAKMSSPDIRIERCTIEAFTRCFWARSLSG